MYTIWIALALAGVLGTSGATPIAGTGYQAGAFQEALVTALLYVGSAAVARRGIAGALGASLAPPLATPHSNRAPVDWIRECRIAPRRRLRQCPSTTSRPW